MAVIDVYRYKKQPDPSAYRLDPSGSNPILTGDLVILDTGNFYLKRMVTGQGPKFLGVALDRGPTPASNVDITANRIKNAPVKHTGVFKFKTTNADSLVHGDAMVIGADSQTLLKRTGEAVTEIIAYFWNPEASAAVAATGEEREFIVQANFPAAGILG
jgi:hypothetical protein